MARIVTLIGTRSEIPGSAPEVETLDRLDEQEHRVILSDSNCDVRMEPVFAGTVGPRAPDHGFVLKDRPPRLQGTMRMRPIAGIEDGVSP